MIPATNTTLNPAQLDRLAIDTIRFLSVDAVQKADSGHPGPVSYTHLDVYKRQVPAESVTWLSSKR